METYFCARLIWCGCNDKMHFGSRFTYKLTRRAYHISSYIVVFNRKKGTKHVVWLMMWNYIYSSIPCIDHMFTSDSVRLGQWKTTGQILWLNAPQSHIFNNKSPIHKIFHQDGDEQRIRYYLHDYEWRQGNIFYEQLWPENVQKKTRVICREKIFIPQGKLLHSFVHILTRF